MGRTYSIVLCICLLSFALPVFGGSPFSGQEEEWNGFSLVRQEGADTPSCEIIVPGNEAEGKPWLWCTSSPDEHGALLRSLLEKGFHIVYQKSRSAATFSVCLQQRDALYNWLTDTASLSKKPLLEASGADALAGFAWAAEHPECVAAIFSVLPLLSPHTSEDAAISEAEWEALAQWLEVDSAASFAKTPLACASALGAAKIPMMLVKKLPVSKWTGEQYDKFYYDYRVAGSGSYDLISCPEKASSEDAGLLFHEQFFFMKYGGLMKETAVGEGVDEASPWVVADFSSQSGVYMLDDVLVLEKGSDMTGIRWREALPSGGYEITLDAMRLSGSDFFCGLTVPYEESAFSLIVGGWGGTCVGISNLNWQDAYNNETARFKTFNSHEWYSIRLRVDGEHIEAWIDGEQMVDVKVDGRDVDIRWEMMPVKPLGIATWRTMGAIRNFRITPL
ncbi:MAG TPA: hypothetical protein PKZ59_08125 [Candidatus Hydrogenedentes bacterium]|nr:hypothetical protein [Candidatus Hydrogenedentota bacterium]